MKTGTRFIAILLILLLAAITLRFVVFTSYIKCQKADFRKISLTSNLVESFELKMPLKMLYQNSTRYQWKERNRELVMNNKHHEVIKVSKNEAFATILLVEDTKENQAFASYFNVENQSNQLTSKLVKLLLSLIFITTEMSGIASLLYLPFKRLLYYQRQKEYLPVFNTVKPPELFI